MVAVSQDSIYSRTDKVLLVVGVFFTFLFGFLLFDPAQSQFDLKGLTSIGSLETQTGVKRRHAKALAWEEVRTKSPIYTKDLVYTPPNSSAEVKLGSDKILVLEPDSLVEFEPITRENFEIVLIRGAGRIKSTQTKKEAPLQVAAPAVLELKPVEKISLPHFFVDTKTWEKAQNEFLEQVARAPQLENLVEFKKPEEVLDFNLTDYVIELLPAKLEEKLKQGTEAWYRLVWTSVPFKDVSYELEVSRSENFNKKVSQILKNNQVEVQFREVGNHFWKIVTKQKGFQQETPPQTISITQTKKDD